MKNVIASLSCAACCLTLPAFTVDAKPTANFAAQETAPIFTNILASSEVVHPLGTVLANIHDFDASQFREAKKEHSMGDRLQVVAVAKGSVGESLGLKPGDVILELDGNYVPKGKNALAKFQGQVLPNLDFSNSFEATIIRNGYAQVLAVDAMTLAKAIRSQAADEG